MMSHNQTFAAARKTQIGNQPLRIQTGQRRFLWARWIWVGLTVLVMIGCGSNEPAISKGSVKLVEKLRASVVAKKADWLEATAKQIDSVHQQGKLSDDEYAALELIVTDGRQEHWDDANTKLLRLINAQQGR
jgi:hypothetical protein